MNETNANITNHHETSDKNILETRLEQTRSQSPETPYAQQLINVLSRRNRYLTVSGYLLVLLAVGFGVATLLMYQQKQFTQLAWENAELARNDQQVQVMALQHQITQSANLLNAKQQAQSSTQASATVELNKLKSQNKTLTQQLAALALKNQAMLKNSKIIAEQNKMLQDEVANASDQLINTIQNQKNNTSSLDILQKQLNQLKTSHTTLQEQNVVLQKEVTNRKSAFNALVKRNQTLQNRLKLSEKSANKYKQKYTKQNRTFVSQKQNNIHLTQKLKDSEARFATLKKEQVTLQKSINQLVGDSLGKPSSTPSDSPPLMP